MADIFCDTSVLVAACERKHPRFAGSSAVVRSIAAGTQRGFISSHCLAEMYTALTRMPVKPRIHPLEAKRLIEENVAAHFQVVSLDGSDYLGVIDRLSALGIPGARIYDALLLTCAEKCSAGRIYTLNIGHFMSVASPATALLIREP